MNNCVNTQSLIKKEFNQAEEKELNRFFQVIKYNKQIKWFCYLYDSIHILLLKKYIF